MSDTIAILTGASRGIGAAMEMCIRDRIVTEHDLNFSRPGWPPRPARRALRFNF